MKQSFNAERYLLIHQDGWKCSKECSQWHQSIFGKLELPHHNGSPAVEIDLSEAMEGRLRAERAPEFNLFDHVAEAGRLSVTHEA